MAADPAPVPEHAPGASVEKLMSCTLAEFETGIVRLTGAAPVALGAGGYDLAAAAGGLPVVAIFEALPDVVLGGLMRLPRVRVTLQIGALGDAARAEFVARFDRTFQRGGG